MAIATENFGTLEGKPVVAATLRAGDLSLRVLSFGARTQSLSLGGRPLILGYDTAEEYLADPFYVGAIVGRIAGRIKDARYEIDGKSFQLDANEGRNSLHGGANGFHKRHWKMETDERQNAIKLTLLSAAGDQGLPGEMEVSVTIRLDHTSLTYQISATPSEPSPVNIVQHNYYNLGGGLMDHKICIHADHTINVTEDRLPVCQFKEVLAHTDLRQTKQVSQIGNPMGAMDQSFVLSQMKLPQISLAGKYARFSMRTNKPCVGLYTGQGLSGKFSPFEGLCLEPQYYPYGFEQAAYRQPLHSAERPYVQVIRLEFPSLD